LTFAEIRRLLHLRVAYVQHLGHGIDDDAHHHPHRRELDVHHDDARALGVLRRGEPELAPKVDDGNHLAAQVDHAQHVRRHLRHLRDVHHFDDLAHLEHGHAVLLVAERERQELAA